MFAVFRSLHMKLMLILLLLITSLMAVVGAFLTTSVSSFYIDTFYEQISAVFSDDSDGYVSTLRARAAEPDGAAGIKEMLEGRAGSLGIDYRTRNYFILDGQSGTYLDGSAEASELPREQTANLLTARNAVAQGDSTLVGDRSDITADYMDAAIPIMGGGNAYIIYILDNKDTVTDLNSQLFLIIMQALVIGLLISVLLSFLLSKTMVGPIEKLTAGAERVAAGDFDSQLPVESTDEIGILTGTFNEMADVLQATLAAVENERNKLDTLFLHMTDGVWPLTTTASLSTAIPPPPTCSTAVCRRALPTIPSSVRSIPSRRPWPSKDPTTPRRRWRWGTGRWSCFWRRFPTRPAAACWWCFMT